MVVQFVEGRPFRDVDLVSRPRCRIGALPLSVHVGAFPREIPNARAKRNQRLVSEGSPQPLPRMSSVSHAFPVGPAYNPSCHSEERSDEESILR